jgi:beta-galactosidase/beta-glucuronidase
MRYADDKKMLSLADLDASQQGKVVDTRTQKISFRRALVVQEKLIDQEGLTFLFEVNNIRIFCGGSNWIPADSFLTKYASAFVFFSITTIHII